MKSMLNYTRCRSLPLWKHAFSMPPIGNGTKRKIFSLNPLKFSKKIKYVLSLAIIFIVLVSVFAFLPKGNQNNNNVLPISTENPTASPTAQPQSTTPPATPDRVSQISRFLNGLGTSIVQAVAPKAPGTIQSNPSMNSSAWQQVAANAWNYFQPGIGVNATTGLPNSGKDFPYFTDWDLGVYIQAVMNANATGLIGTDGPWGSSARLEKVVQFLETRELNNASYPYWFYQSSDGKDYHDRSDSATSPVDIVDTGRLLVALNNLRTFNTSLAATHK